ncbi:MAG: lysophospholipid acyltransferase family protein [Nitriliruptor sp.]
MERQRHTWKWRAITALVVVFVRLCGWKVEVQGLEHVPRTGGAVLAFNHHSYLDFVMLAWAPVLRLRRTVRFLAKREMWASPWVGWLARWAEAVPVDRRSATARADAYGAAVAALEAGDLVAVAPEQTISTSFELLPFRAGAVRMAQRAGVPIVPVIGWGTQRLAAKGHGVRLGEGRGIPVVVRYGPPVHVGPDEDPRAATARLQEVMTVLLDEVQRSYPDGAPAGRWWVPARLGGSAPDHDEVVRAHEERFRRGGPSTA